MEVKNTTATLVQRLSSTEARLVRVEVLVLFSSLAWVLLELFGSFRRRYSHGFFRLFVWTVYTLSTVLAPYTTGLLQAGPFRDQTFVLWGTILLLIQVNSDSLSVYSIQDIEQWKRMQVQQVLQIFLVLWLIINGSGHNNSYTATIWIFYIQSIIMTFSKFGNLRNVSKKGSLVAHSKVIADYMLVEHQLAPVFNARTMEGYSYIFDGEVEVASLLATTPEYRVTRLQEMTDDKYITIDSVWRWIDSHNFKYKKTAEEYKDTALSFTLFKLLKRRFCGYPLSEAGHKKTLQLVLHGLLRGNGTRYIRAFRVIEEELLFLYNFFYTRIESSGLNFLVSKVVITSVIGWNCISGAFSRHYHRSNLEQRVNGTDVIHCVTIVLLANIFVAYFAGALLDYDRSLIVDELRDYVMDETESDGITTPQTETETVTVTESPNRRTGCTWERKLGQYSLLLNFDYDPRNALSYLSLGLVEATRKGQKAGEKIKLADTVIVRVLSQFKKNKGKLENGQAALARNQLGSQFSWACTLPTHTASILVWHIATTISGNNVPLEGNDDLLVALSLSDYCAYLVAFVPDMLPGHGYDTRCTFDAVVMEARQRLAGCETLSSRCEKLMTDLHDDDGTILDMGAKLGRQLRCTVPDEAQRWKLLADFWAEFILFLAPSDNAEIHAEKLAAGGEFMTHLWVLLTHAGILERPSPSSGIDPGPGGGLNGTTTAQDSEV